MVLPKEKKKEVIEKFKKSEKDTGSAEVQVALITERINQLTGHFKPNKKDHHSRQVLLKLVGHRRSLLDYLKKYDLTKYRAMLEKLDLRK